MFHVRENFQPRSRATAAIAALRFPIQSRGASRQMACCASDVITCIPLHVFFKPLHTGPSILFGMKKPLPTTWTPLRTAVRSLVAKLRVADGEIERPLAPPEPRCRRREATPPHQLGVVGERAASDEIAPPRDTAAGLTTAPHAQGPAAVHGDPASRAASARTRARSAGDSPSSTSSRMSCRPLRRSASTASVVLKR